MLLKNTLNKIKKFPQSFFILKDLFLFLKKQKNTKKRFKFNFFDLKPILYEKTTETKFDSHYIYHPAWAARCLQKIKPKEHIDISSTLYFSTIVSAFITVKFYDYRPALLNLDNLESSRVNLTSLPFKDNSIDSLSCMHTVEHIGLGRYGDSIDPDADIKAINELKRVLAKNGHLLFVVPVGIPKIEFNAHRIYSYEQIFNYFKGLKLKNFSLVTDSGDFIEDANEDLVKKQKYGCGCFWFINKK